MATRQTGHKNSKGWRARVKMNWVEYYLGTFPTKEEAVAVEQKFKNYYKNEAQ